MSEGERNKATWLIEAVSWLPLAAAIVTTIVFGAYSWMLAAEVVTLDNVTQTRFQHFLAGSPNSMGDTLAGFVGSLTLIWVVASVVQQSIELRAQRREFSAMVKAQDAQVAALEQQAAIFADERLARDESRSDATFMELQGVLRRQIESVPDYAMLWVIKGSVPPEVITHKPHSSGLSTVSLFCEEDVNMSDEQYISRCALQVVDCLIAVSEKWQSSELVELPRRIPLLENVLITLKEINLVSLGMSSAKRIRMNETMIPAMNRTLTKLWEADLFWETQLDEGEQ